jgi:hypothetical protein
MIELGGDTPYDSPPLKEIDVEEVFEAIKKNGFEYVREAWFSYEPDGTVKGGCVLGQAALNLSVPASNEEVYETNLVYALDNLGGVENEKWIDPAFCSAGTPIGGAIVAWNDRMVGVDGAMQYVLKTYEEVTQMAYDLLSPYFGEKIYLSEYKYY